MDAIISQSQHCECKRDYPLAKHTTWKVGGSAAYCFFPKSLHELQLALRSVPDNQSPFFLGLGSNTLIRDQGISGYVIITRGLSDLVKLKNENRIVAQAGVSCASLARFAARNGLGGLEFLAGIPGTVGGALAMNAGANGCEMWDRVESVEVITRSGSIIKRKPEEFSVTYRKAKGNNDEWFATATLHCPSIDKVQSFSIIKQYLQRREETQPINQANCGCVFKNPSSEQPAGQLIERAGLKGKVIGGAMVSPKHANFVVNCGNATAADIEALLCLVSDSIFDKYAVRLQHEVKIIGEGTSQG